MPGQLHQQIGQQHVSQHVGSHHGQQQSPVGTGRKMPAIPTSQGQQLHQQKHHQLPQPHQPHQLHQQVHSQVSRTDQFDSRYQSQYQDDFTNQKTLDPFQRQSQSQRNVNLLQQDYQQLNQPEPVISTSTIVSIAPTQYKQAVVTTTTASKYL